MSLCLVTQSCPILCGPTDYSRWLLWPWGSPGESTGVGCHALLQGIFPIQGSKPGLWHCRQILYHLSHQEINNFYLLVRRKILFKREVTPWMTWKFRAPSQAEWARLSVVSRLCDEERCWILFWNLWSRNSAMAYMWTDMSFIMKAQAQNNKKYNHDF